MTRTISRESVRPSADELLFSRFEPIEELGAGGFGRVLCCRDHETHEVVALKVLHRFGPDALLRFKTEFRAISDVQHPNLVRLGELFAGASNWAFSMEYVPGTDARAWVRTRDNDPGFDEQRLRALTVQLSYGLMAIHEMGMLHRDIKPPNVRVTPEGRVVVLDFGLVSHLQRSGKHSSESSSMGTAAYMAPEQASATRLGPAADFYAFGVLLYELLTGRLPFDGSAMHIMLEKQHRLPPSPHALMPGIPSDLEEVCMGLLATRPDERLDGEAVLTRLAASTGATFAAPRAISLRHDELVGRKREQQALTEHFESVLDGDMRLVLVEGESGLGKSALVQHFAYALQARHSEVLLCEGRCHAAEQLGYKAFDGVVDELSLHLKNLTDEQCRSVLPEQAQRLPVLFPVLARVSLIHRALQRSSSERVERYPLFQAFLELLVRVSREQPLLFVVDDLQWADEASLVLIKTLLESPRRLRLLMVCTVRPLDGLQDSVGAHLRTLLAESRVVRLPIEQLERADALSLSAKLLGDVSNPGLIERIASEARGHPLFMAELARYADTGPARSVSDVGLDRVIVERVRELENGARGVLERICVAGGPLPTSVLRQVPGERPEVLHECLGNLRAQHLIRAARRGEVVVYHDRIREAVLGTLDAETLAGHHRVLATAWQSSRDVEPAVVARHLLAGGLTQRALRYLELAAHKAERAGVFERAAEHYQSLLLLTRDTAAPGERHPLRVAWSEALANAGRCEASARALLEGLDEATDSEAADLSIRAAQRLLQAGNVEEGLRAARRAFDLLQIPWPKTSLRALLRILWNRSWIALTPKTSGESRSQGHPQHTQDRELVELDALRRLVLPIVWVDLLRSAELSSRHASLALRTHASEHVAYALCSEATLRAMQRPDHPAIARLFEQAARFRRRRSTPELDAHAAFTRGTVAICRGDHGQAEQHLEEAELLYRNECPGAVWELANARGVLLNTWYIRGRYRKHAECTQAWMDEAEVRGDRFALATYSIAGMGCLRHLQRHDLQAALKETARVMAPWQSEGIGIQHFMQVCGTGWLFSYEPGEQAEAFWAEQWPRLTRSFLFRMPAWRELLIVSRLGTLLANSQRSSTAVEQARQLVRPLLAGQSPNGVSWGRYMAAQVAWLDGKRERAAELAADAARRFASQGMHTARFSEVLAARASGDSNADSVERKFRSELETEGFEDSERALYWQLPVARTFR